MITLRKKGNFAPVQSCGNHTRLAVQRLWVRISSHPKFLIGVKAMPGLIPGPNSGSFYVKRKKNVAKWGTLKNEGNFNTYCMMILQYSKS